MDVDKWDDNANITLLHHQSTVMAPIPYIVARFADDSEAWQEATGVVLVAAELLGDEAHMVAVDPRPMSWSWIPPAATADADASYKAISWLFNAAACLPACQVVENKYHLNLIDCICTGTNAPETQPCLAPAKGRIVR